MKITFVTGNRNKADYLTKKLGFSIDHHNLDLDEIQSLDLHEVVEHKVRQAYDKLKAPVLVEDVSVVIDAWGDLPGPLVKWFLGLNMESLNKMLSAFDNRNATARTVYALYSGGDVHFFEGEMRGTISTEAKGERGFGWDRIFVNEGYNKTRGEMTEIEYDQSSYRRSAIEKLKEFLQYEDQL
jgi:non-canonical purine NTP pyrophosphatase (RdgB/HAM1 family)